MGGQPPKPCKRCFTNAGDAAWEGRSEEESELRNFHDVSRVFGRSKDFAYKKRDFWGRIIYAPLYIFSFRRFVLLVAF